MIAVSSKDRSDGRIERVRCPSRIGEVTVYARGAVVTRRVELPPDLSPDAIDLVVEAITPLAEPGSFRVEVDGDREALGVVTELEVPEDERTRGDLEEELQRVRREIRELSARRMRWETRRAAIGRTQPIPRLSKKRASLDPSGKVENALGAQALLGELERELDEKIVALDREIADRKKELERLETEAAQREGSAVRKKHHPELRAVIRLGAGDAPIRSLFLSYSVKQARWWPTYAVHLTEGARKAELFVDALVAQATFEDWRDVRIALSTADMIRDVRLPELSSLRLGRQQPMKKRGFREPPGDLDLLFASYEEAVAIFVRTPPAVPEGLRRLRSEPPPEPRKTRETFDEDVTGVGWAAEEPAPMEDLFSVSAGTIPPPPVPPPAQPVSFGAGGPPTRSLPIPMAMPASAPIGAPVPRRSAGPGAIIGGVLEAAADGIAALAESSSLTFKTADPSGIEPADAWLDFDSLRMGNIDDRNERGRLVRVRRVELVAELYEEIRLVDVSNDKLRDPLTSRGAFDHRYEAEGTAEVPANGRAHRVSLTRAKVPAKARFVTVPRKVPDVFREVELINPLESPLLAGPIDVMLDGALLTTTALTEPVDRGGSFSVGLGVEERVRVARNARVRESTVGMLSTATAIDHQVAIEIVSGLGHPIAVEVLERIPVTDDKAVKIELLESTPPAEPYDQKERGRPIDGGLKWKIAIDPGGRRTLSYTYRIELPAKSEIQGGNRRE